LGAQVTPRHPPPSGVTTVRDLDLDLDAFEGPFDLLLTLVLKEELELADVEVAEIVLTALNAPHLSREEIEIWGEFLVLFAALLDLKARQLFPDEETDFDELDPEDAAGELAERLALYRRFKAAAQWLDERLEAESDRYFRLGPAPLAPVPKRPLDQQDPQELVAVLRALAAEPPEPSLRHLTLTFPPVSLFLQRFRAVLRSRRRFVFDREVGGLTRIEQAVAFLALLELRKGGEVALGQAAPFDPITVWSTT
jgi:segregation and condensation protein A